MLTEGKTCIITKYSELKKELEKKKPSEDKLKRIGQSISKLSSSELEAVYKG